MKTSTKMIIGIICLMAGMFQGANAQISMTSLGTVLTQNFNGLPTSVSTNWSNNSTLANWYAERSSGSTAIPFKSDNGSSTTMGLYSYGSTSSSDRALGALPSGTAGNVYMAVRLKNNTGATINAFTITFSAEQWRAEGSKSQTIAFAYKKSSSALTDCGTNDFTNVTSLDFESPTLGNLGAIDGNASGNKETKTYSITGVALGSGQEIMFRWYFKKKKNVSHGYSIDDLTIVAANPTIYYSKSTGALNLTSSWGTSTNGTGTAPSNFTSANAIYIAANNSAPTLSAAWTVSGSGSKVILGTGSAINFTVPASYSMTGAIDLSSSSTLTLSNASLPTIGSVAATATIVFNSSSSQTLPAGTYNDLTINGGGTKILGGDITVNGALTFTSGKIQLGAYDLIMGPTATLSGASSSNYVITNGVGCLVREVQDNSTAVSFPVGTSTAYNPVSLTQPAAGTDDNFSVRAYEGFYTSYDASDAPTSSVYTLRVVKKTWAIDEETAGGSSLSITLQWNAADEGTSFNRTQSYVAHFTGGAWTRATAGAASGSGPYTRQITGITSFSPFSVGDNSSPLPVQLVSFTGQPITAANKLNWVTASEINNSGFEVERMAEGTSEFVSVHFEPGNGTVSTVSKYSYTDVFTGNAYYRLRQMDFDGKFEYSPVIYLSRKGISTEDRISDATLHVYPNPAVSQVQVELKSDVEGNLSGVKVVDITGKEYATPIQFDGKTASIDLSGLKKGLYFIYALNGNDKLSQKLLIQ